MHCARSQGGPALDAARSTTESRAALLPGAGGQVHAQHGHLGVGQAAAVGNSERSGWGFAVFVDP